MQDQLDARPRPGIYVLEQCGVEALRLYPLGWDVRILEKHGVQDLSGDVYPGVRLRRSIMMITRCLRWTHPARHGFRSYDGFGESGNYPAKIEAAGSGIRRPRNSAACRGLMAWQVPVIAPLMLLSATFTIGTSDRRRGGRPRAIAVCVMPALANLAKQKSPSLMTVGYRPLRSTARRERSTSSSGH
jgi:hypothetical protein